MPVEAASPMGCVERVQWCNSAYPGYSGCGPLASLVDSIDGALPYFNMSKEELDITDNPTWSTTQGARLIWSTLMQITGMQLSGILSHPGQKSLESQSLMMTGVQFGLQQNQWQHDVTNWWNTVLAYTQSVYVQTALGSRDPDLQDFQWRPSNDGERSLCQNQVCTIGHK